MNVLGLSCHHHDAAACLVRDGVVVAAAHEERFTRRKACSDLPVQAARWCLGHAGIGVADLDRVAFYEKPYLKLERVVMSHLRSWPRSLPTFLRTMPAWLGDRLVVPLELENTLGYRGEVAFVRHHSAHAASAFLPSPFESAAILTVDGVGEWACSTLARGRGDRIDVLAEQHYPDSLGLLYTAVTVWLGFEALQGEGKVMALADFGEPRHLEAFRELVDLREDGSIRLDPHAFGVVEGQRMVGPGFVDRFGPPRQPGDPLEPRHHDVAASLQALLEDAVCRMARHLAARTGEADLCIAGGVGLNISATSRILEETPFRRLYIQPAAGDAGGALGAAVAVHHALNPGGRRWTMADARLGPAYDDAALRAVLEAHGAPVRRLDGDALADEVADRIARGGVIGWFQGRMEYGPRALGARSILADPRDPDMKDRLNARVKHREAFRPYGVSVLRDAVGEWFTPDRPSPFMLQVARVRPEVAARIPSAVHVNGTTRLQTVEAEPDPLYHRLLGAFGRRTGVPMVLNTSFNDRDEPMVCSPEDAWRCFARTGLDTLVLGPYLVDRRA